MFVFVFYRVCTELTHSALKNKNEKHAHMEAKSVAKRSERVQPKQTDVVSYAMNEPIQLHHFSFTYYEWGGGVETNPPANVFKN